MRHLLLLHGAVGAPSQLEPLAGKLRTKYDVHVPGFSGHGGIPFAREPFSMQAFAEDVLKYMDEKQLQQVSIFGYSMGGYVAMYLAKHYPGKIDRVITLATKYEWDETIAAREIQMLEPARISQKIPAFADALAQRHAPNDWKEVLAKTSGMMVALGKDNILKLTDYETMIVPALLLLGDRDKMVSLAETVNIYKALPGAQMALLPGTPHPLEQVDISLLGFMIERFLQ